MNPPFTQTSPILAILLSFPKPRISPVPSQKLLTQHREGWAALPPGTRVVSLLLCTPSAGPRAPACTRSLQGHWPQAQGAAAAAAAAAAGSAEVEVLMMTMGVMAGRAAIAAAPDVTRVTSALSATSTHRGTQRSWGLPNQDSSILCFVHRIYPGARTGNRKGAAYTHTHTHTHTYIYNQTHGYREQEGRARHLVLMPLRLELLPQG